MSKPTFIDQLTPELAAALQGALEFLESPRNEEEQRAVEFAIYDALDETPVHFSVRILTLASLTIQAFFKLSMPRHRKYRKVNTQKVIERLRAELQDEHR